MLIPSNDISIYIDVTCYKCRKRVSLPNVMEVDGRKYCAQCAQYKILPDDTRELFETHHKSPEIDHALDSFAIMISGTTRDSGNCVFCRSGILTRKDFRDELSWKEFGISRLCQSCQDKVFGV